MNCFFPLNYRQTQCFISQSLVGELCSPFFINDVSSNAEIDKRSATVLINLCYVVAHSVVDDDEVGASPVFLCSLWLTMNNRNSERHAICCDWQQVFPRTVEICGSSPCHAWWRLYSAIWVCQFCEAHFRTHRRGFPWAGDHLPYDGRGSTSADVAASCYTSPKFGFAIFEMCRIY